MALAFDWHFVLNGLVLNGEDAYGVLWGIDQDGVDGWGSTAPSLGIIRKPRSSGGWAGDSFGGPRTVALSGWMKAPTEALAATAFDRLIAAVDRDPFTLEGVEAGRSRTMTVQRSDSVITRYLSPLSGKWSIQVQSKDWRKFGTPLVKDTLLPSSSGGLTIPFTIPFTIASVLVAGQVALTNPGNEIGPVRLRVDGPTTGPVITHVGSGQSLVFSSSLVLAAGEWLDIDMEKHTVLANGQSSRSSYITSRGWSGFEPGPNVWAFTAASYNAASKLTVTATPADE